MYVATHLPQDNTVRSTVGDALRRFRQGSTRADVAQPAGGLPSPGVYRYATGGGENLVGIVSSSHHYGGISTIVISPSPCGFSERWQIFTARWSEERHCHAARRLHLSSLREHREFFGAARSDSYRCTGGPPRRPARLRVGEHWLTRCRSGDSLIVDASRVAGFSTIVVGGHAIAAVHLHSRTVLAGESSGTARRDEWRRRSDGLLLRRRASSHVSFDFLGGGSYSETLGLRLLSAAPRT